jgi:hypothetical protein
VKIPRETGKASANMLAVDDGEDEWDAMIETSLHDMLEKEGIKIPELKDDGPSEPEHLIAE